MLLFHAVALSGIGWWYIRAYRKAAHRSRREVERLLANDKSAALHAELDYIRRRHDILMKGLFPHGDIFLGAFIEEEPELRALCDLLRVCRDDSVAGTAARRQ